MDLTEVENLETLFKRLSINDVGQLAITDFPKFAKLPPEVRIKIWAGAMPGPRFIQILLYAYSSEGLGYRYYGPVKEPHIHLHLFQLRAACKEAYDEVMRRYRAISFVDLDLFPFCPEYGRWLETTFNEHCIILLDDNLDAIYFNQDVVRFDMLISSALAILPGFLITSVAHPSLRHISFNASLCIDGTFQGKLEVWLPNFPKLQKLSLVHVRRDLKHNEPLRILRQEASTDAEADQHRDAKYEADIRGFWSRATTHGNLKCMTHVELEFLTALLRDADSRIL